MMVLFAVMLAATLVTMTALRGATALTRRAHGRRTLTMVILFLVAVAVKEGLRRLELYPKAVNALDATADLLVAMNVIAASGVVLFEAVLPRVGVRVASIVSDVTMGLAYLVALLVVIRHAGLDLSGIITTSAVVTGVLALSLQATLGNVIGGVALQADNSIEAGDWIELDNGDKGVVTRIGWRHTVVETNNWDTLIVPNATLLASTIKILGKRGGERVPHRMWVFFNVDFRYTPSDVVRVVDHALQSAPIEGVANEPKPNCVCMDLAGDGRDSMARYGARYWITDLRIDDPTNSRVRARIVAALRRAEIPLAVPTSHVSLEKDTESRRQRKRERELKRSREALTTLPFLAACSEEELDELAEHIDHVPFEAGEVVTSQGAVAHFLYIIVRGTAEVRVYQGTEYEAVNVVKGPTYVGEMGLMTGAPRGATVVAVTDLDCFRLDKQAFGHVLEAHPEMVEAISDLLSKRTAALKAARTELAGEQAPPEENRRIGAAIRRFFGLDGG